MTICHGIPWYRNGADDHCPFIIEGWWLFFYPLSYLTLTVGKMLMDEAREETKKKTARNRLQKGTRLEEIAEVLELIVET